MDVEHVVVLMLENRSFDCMLGALYPGNPDFDGLDGTQRNIWHKPDGTVQIVPAWNDPNLTAKTLVIPDPDPGESFKDIAEQIDGGAAHPEPMGGFVDNYMGQNPGDPSYDPRAVMHYFTPDQVPAISTLAKSFGVCDRWFASAPNQTWPNRFFAHTGTAGGFANNSPPHFPYRMETVFNRLSGVGKDWSIYFHDFPQSATLARIWPDVTHFKHFEEHFASDAAAGLLPAYSFIEPRYFADPLLNKFPNDEHPPHNVGMAEQLVVSIYNALRSGAKWGQTLFIITCDEHGGCYDHVPPPAATPPDALTPDGIVFDRFGVRVPTVIVSPHVPKGSILRAPGAIPFDHTSIIATLRAIHGFEHLTARDRAAPSVLDVLDFGIVNDGPGALPGPRFPSPDPAAVAAMAAEPPNGLQASLNGAARALPPVGAELGVHLDSLARTGVQEIEHGTVAEAFDGVAENFKSFLSRV